ncbi:hypothetical protein [Escherichia coli]
MPASKEDLRLKLMEVVNALSESQGSTPQEIIEILNAIPAQDFIKEDNANQNIVASVEDESSLAEAQAKADSAYSNMGRRAPAPFYGQEIIDYIQKARGEVSTSPSVVFCGASGGAEVPDVMGEDNFFIEGTPFLIDHVALVPLGVWDKGGKPSGVEVTTPTAEEQLAGMVRDVIDAACKPALEKLEEISGRLAQLEKEG